MELLRQSPSPPKTALVAALDKTTQLFHDTAIRRGIKIPSDTLLQSCKRSCACGQCLSPCYSSLLVNSVSEKKDHPEQLPPPTAFFLLPTHSTISPILAHPSILGKRSRIAGKGWREGEHLLPPFSFLPGRRLFSVLGLMGQGAQHRSEGQGWAPSAGNKATFMGAQKSCVD